MDALRARVATVVAATARAVRPLSDESRASYATEVGKVVASDAFAERG